MSLEFCNLSSSPLETHLACVLLLISTTSAQLTPIIYPNWQLSTRHVLVRRLTLLQTIILQSHLHQVITCIPAELKSPPSRRYGTVGWQFHFRLYAKGPHIGRDNSVFTKPKQSDIIVLLRRPVSWMDVFFGNEKILRFSIIGVAVEIEVTEADVADVTTEIYMCNQGNVLAC